MEPLRTLLRSALRPRRSDAAPAGDEGGFVLTWFALLLVALMAMAGFSVDVWNWWYTGQQNQRAADAGALAGVVHLPGDLPGATSAAEAEVMTNGYPTSAATVALGDRANQLEVTVDKTVTNNFVGVLGITTTDISRSATAEYQGPVPMGSPVNQLGNDPFGDQSDETVAPRFWLNVAAPNATTQSGDRHQAKNCSSSPLPDNCDGNPDPTTDNADYEPAGYAFRVDVRSLSAGPLSIQAYDPGFFFTGDRCTNNMFAGGDARLATLASHDPAAMGDAAQRYVTGNTRYCAGDQSIQGDGIDTTFIVRAPDNTPFDDTDNPVVCTRRFESRNGNTDALFNMLMNDSPTSPEGLRFRDYFRQWAELCSIASPEVGEYVVQVRSNATAATPTAYDPTINDGGHNRYSVRAGFGSGSSINGSDVGLFANGRLPIYVNQNDGTSSTNFYLARLEPLNSNRNLVLQFFDIGDVSSGSVTLTIVPPSDATVGGSPMTVFTGCQFTPEGEATENLATCSRSGMNSANFQGEIVTVRIPVPDDYDCNEADFVNGCWTRVRMDFTGGAVPTDTTTWSASIEGDPVRLID